MSKQEFLTRLRKGLSGLPQEDIEERLAFYSEMIDDQMEEGLAEEEAVSAVGTVDEIVTQVVAETPLAKIAKERIETKRRLNAGEIVLLVLGSPIWLSFVIAAFAVVLSIYISIWAVIISLWAVFVSLAAGSICGVLSCIIFAIGGNVASGIAMLAAGIVCAGLSILMFYGCKAATKGILILTKKTATGIKNYFMKKRKRNEKNNESMAYYSGFSCVNRMRPLCRRNDRARMGFYQAINDEIRNKHLRSQRRI